MGYIQTRAVSRTQSDEGALWLGALKQARTASRTQSGLSE